VARIAGIDLPDNKQILYALRISTAGPVPARKILAAVNIAPNRKVKELTDDEVAASARRSRALQGRRRVARRCVGHIKHYIEIGSYRGDRHRRRLPVRGQRTRTNAARARDRARPRASSR